MEPAANIIAKCGGARAVAKIVGCSENWVFRWRLATDKGGTGGLIPAKAQKKLMQASKDGLFDLKPDDFFEGV
jgi:hypothetical protein